ncbi:MAG: sensor histidine kinase, partial [Candidatus Nitrosocosmicus sp.]
GKSIKFSVYDNGPGIPPEEADNLFQKFYQIDTSETRKHSGTGLGLVICKGIIEAHGGKIWIDKEYTTGACFVFTIPLAKGKEKGGLDITL